MLALFSHTHTHTQILNYIYITVFCVLITSSSSYTTFNFKYKDTSHRSDLVGTWLRARLCPYHSATFIDSMPKGSVNMQLKIQGHFMARKTFCGEFPFIFCCISNRQRLKCSSAQASPVPNQSLNAESLFKGWCTVSSHTLMYNSASLRESVITGFSSAYSQ